MPTLGARKVKNAVSLRTVAPATAGKSHRMFVCMSIGEEEEAKKKKKKKKEEEKEKEDKEEEKGIYHNDIAL